MIGKPTICKKCLFFQTGCKRNHYNYICIAKIRPAIDFVTGKRKFIGYRLCKEVNTNGKCSDYKEKKE